MVDIEPRTNKKLYARGTRTEVLKIGQSDMLRGLAAGMAGAIKGLYLK